MMCLPEPQGWQSYFMLVTIQSYPRQRLHLGFFRQRVRARNKHTRHPPSPIQPPAQPPNQSPTAPTAPKVHKTTSSSTPSPSSHPPAPPHRPAADTAKAAAAGTQQPPCPPQPRGQTRGTPRRAAQGTWAALCSIAGVASMAARRWSHGGCMLVCLRARRSGGVGSRVGRNCCVMGQFSGFGINDVCFVLLGRCGLVYIVGLWICLSIGIQ